MSPFARAQKTDQRQNEPALAGLELVAEPVRGREARLFVRGFAAHQVAVALVGLASLARRDLRRPAMALAAATDVADIVSAAIEARSRARVDADLSDGIVFSSAGLGSALLGMRSRLGRPEWRASVSTITETVRGRPSLRNVPEQNPITRIEQVALDLGRLAEEVGDYLGPEARTALRYWRGELLHALDALRHQSTVR